MTTLNYQVGATGDSGRVIPALSYLDTSVIYVGQSGAHVNDGWCRFTGVTIPNGTTITSAYISYYSYNEFGSSLPPSTAIYFEKSANPAAPSSSSDYTSRTLTTNSVAWNPSTFLLNTWYNSPDITAIINELLSNFSYASGAAMQVLHYDTGSSENFYIPAYSYAGGASYAPKLVITYGSVNHYSVSLSDAMRYQDTPVNRHLIPMSISEGMKSGDVDTNQYTNKLSLADGTKLQDTISNLLKSFPTLSEGIRLGDTSSTRSKTFPSLPEGFLIADLPTVTAAINHYMLSLLEGIKANDAGTNKNKTLPLINESIRLSDNPFTNTLYHLFTSEGFDVQDSLNNFYQLAISEGLSIQEVESYTHLWAVLIAGSLLASREIGGSKTYTLPQGS